MITPGMYAHLVGGEENVQKVMQFWMDNHRETYELTGTLGGGSYNTQYSGSDSVDPHID